ncbi:hypothetical protein OG500_28685 [Kitasatospora sp. NBC_01250]|uniref:hypothetical protein n=1 Tax=Kitasatospora sp. NBC_01250 TaxID=2903571 RepID=UPI002E2EB615|nr:hypothetical protein [Kitasatospora sp. NBC_01250]
MTEPVDPAPEQDTGGDAHAHLRALGRRLDIAAVSGAPDRALDRLLTRMSAARLRITAPVARGLALPCAPAPVPLRVRRLRLVA